MVVVNGATEVARQMAAYLLLHYRYLAERNAWANRMATRDAQISAHQRQVASHVSQITQWNVDRSLNIHVGARPVNPGLAPDRLKDPEPKKPAEPQNLNVHPFNNVPVLLPVAPGSQQYWAADVGGPSGGAQGRGQHRVIVLADTTTGHVIRRFCTADHYADHLRNTRASFTEF